MRRLNTYHEQGELPVELGVGQVLHVQTHSVLADEEFLGELLRNSK